VAGPCVGLVLAVLTSYVILKFKHPVLEMVIMFSSPFLAFYIAEDTSVKVSGVLTLVAFGLYMGLIGKVNLTSESRHLLHFFWEFIAYTAETIIFLLTGNIIGTKFMILKDEITPYDGWMIIPIFIFLNLIRFLIVIVFYPILKRGDPKFTW